MLNFAVKLHMEMDKKCMAGRRVAVFLIGNLTCTDVCAFFCTSRLWYRLHVLMKQSAGELLEFACTELICLDVDQLVLQREVYPWKVVTADGHWLLRSGSRFFKINFNV